MRPSENPYAPPAREGWGAAPRVSTSAHLGRLLMLPVATGGRWAIGARRIEDSSTALSGVHPAAANATVLLARQRVDSRQASA